MVTKPKKVTKPATVAPVKATVAPVKATGLLGDIQGLLDTTAANTAITQLINNAMNKPKTDNSGTIQYYDVNGNPVGASYTGALYNADGTLADEGLVNGTDGFNGAKTLSLH
jgi:hypothetical protein